MGSQNTALHIACENGDLESVKILIQYGADIQQLNKDKETSLLVAERNVKPEGQYEEIYRYLSELWQEKESHAMKVKDELVQ